MGAVLGGFSSYLVQKENLSHEDRSNLTKTRQEAYVTFIDAVNTVTLNGARLTRLGAAAEATETVRQEAIADREKLAPALERINLLASRQVFVSTVPLMEHVTRLVDVIIANPPDIQVQLRDLREDINAARSAFINQVRREIGTE